MSDLADDLFGWEFEHYWKGVQEITHDGVVARGFRKEPVPMATSLLLLHAEISEATEALRDGNPPSDKIPAFSGIEEELADTVLRIMDLAEAEGLDVCGALLAKIDYNASRPHKHGGKEF